MSDFFDRIRPESGGIKIFICRKTKKAFYLFNHLCVLTENNNKKKKRVGLLLRTLYSWIRFSINFSDFVVTLESLGSVQFFKYSISQLFFCFEFDHFQDIYRSFGFMSSAYEEMVLAHSMNIL